MQNCQVIGFPSFSFIMIPDIT